MTMLTTFSLHRQKSILHLFDYYASLGSGDVFSMQINSWGELMNNTHIADENSANSKLSDYDRIL